MRAEGAKDSCDFFPPLGFISQSILPRPRGRGYIMPPLRGSITTVREGYSSVESIENISRIDSRWCRINGCDRPLELLARLRLETRNGHAKLERSACRPNWMNIFEVGKIFSTIMPDRSSYGIAAIKA